MTKRSKQSKGTRATARDKRQSKAGDGELRLTGFIVQGEAGMVAVAEPPSPPIVDSSVMPPPSPRPGQPRTGSTGWASPKRAASSWRVDVRPRPSDHEPDRRRASRPRA